MLAQGLRFALQFGSQIVLARLLDPSQFGLIAMTAPILAFVQTVNDLGLGQAIVYRPEITQRQISAMFWVTAGISTLLTIVVLLAAPALAWLYDEPPVTPVTRVLGGLILLSGLSIVPSALLNRRMRFEKLAIADVASLSAGTAVGVVAALHGLNSRALVLMQVAASVVSFVLIYSFAGWRPAFPAGDPAVKSLLRFGTFLLVQTPLLVRGATKAGLVSTVAGVRAIGPFALASAPAAITIAVLERHMAQPAVGQILLSEALADAVSPPPCPVCRRAGGS